MRKTRHIIFYEIHQFPINMDSIRNNLVTTGYSALSKVSRRFKTGIQPTGPDYMYRPDPVSTTP